MLLVAFSNEPLGFEQEFTFRSARLSMYVSFLVLISVYKIGPQKDQHQ